MLQWLPRCRVQFGCIARQNDAVTATPNRINEDGSSQRCVLRGDPFDRVGKPLTTSFDAGGSLRDLQDAMGYADPRTTRRYDRARYSLDRSPGYALAGYLAETESGA